MDWNSIGHTLGLTQDCVINNVPTLSCIPVVFAIVIDALFALVGSASVIVIMYSGIRMIISRNDAKELETAHKTFFYALIGLVVVLLSFLFINIISYVVKVPCITKFGFDCQ